MTDTDAPGADPQTREPAARTATTLPLWRRITGNPFFHLVAAFVVVGLILSFVAKPYVVPSGSMEETLIPGDRVLVNRLTMLGGDPHTGDVVVFDAGAAWDGERAPASDPVRAALHWIGEVSGFGPSGAHTLIKRVIAGPGQTAKCCSVDGAVEVDGTPLDEPYVFEDYPFEPGTLDCTTTPRSLRCFDAVTVPDGSFLMLGDHRSMSSDSSAACRGVADAPAACWRWATREAIVGSAVAIIWPFGRWSGL